MDINPIITSFKFFNIPITLTWYGLIVMTGVIIGAWFAEKEVRRRGENGEVLMDAMIGPVIIGILGARLWYVVNAILGGNNTFVEDPLSIIRPPIAGIHFFGGLLFGGLALVIYLKRKGYDAWLFMDAVAPVALLGQAVGRLGNFINQELYGPPTTLPWGIPISLDHRLPQFASLDEATRFHPTFAYEMILNILAFLFIAWYVRKDEHEKPGTAFSLWLMSAGFIRTFIEFFRPDQPRIGDSFISYTMAVAFLMGIAGLVLFLARNGKLHIPALENWEEEYFIKPVEKKPTSTTRTRTISVPPEIEEEENVGDAEEEDEPIVKKKTATKKTVAKKTTTKRKTSK